MGPRHVLLLTVTMALGACAQREPPKADPALAGYSNQLLYKYVEEAAALRRDKAEAKNGSGVSVVRGGDVVSTAPLVPVARAPSDLQRPVTVMPGDIEEQMTAIAGQLPGWAIVPPSGVRTGPVLVQVRVIGRTAYEVLRDISAAAGGAADVVVNEQRKTIQVRYPER